jgi:hypothetical protein
MVPTSGHILASHASPSGRASPPARPFGLQLAQDLPCRLGIKINVDRMPTHEELVDAIERSGLSLITIDLGQDRTR